jgi:DNA-directed RNA polymerase beta' subunit
MSTVKFGVKKSTTQGRTPVQKEPIKPGKEEVAEPQSVASETSRAVSAFKNLTRKSASSSTSTGSTSTGSTSTESTSTSTEEPTRTTGTIEAKKSNQIPSSAATRQVRVLTEDKGCPAVLLEEDLNRLAEETLALEENLEEYEIVGAEIDILDIESLIKSGTCPKITNGDTEAVRGSLSDSRMGVVENNAVCGTCFKDNVGCPGHHGYIELNAPVYHPLFVSYIPKILSSICITCGKLFFTEEQMKEKGLLNYRYDKRISKLAQESANQMCQSMDTSKHRKKGEKFTRVSATKAIQKWWRKLKNIKVKPCTGSQIQFVWNKDCMQIQAVVDEDTAIEGVTFDKVDACQGAKKQKGRTIPIRYVEDILKSIDTEALRLMDFYRLMDLYDNNNRVAHPKKFIMHYLAVLPPISRQPKFTDNKVIPDKLTEQYRTIITKNDQLGAAKKENKATATRALYDEIDKFIQGSDSGKKGDFKSITRRIQGKKERIRDNMMGRRVNFSARSVIGPKPSLRFGQVAVPRVWAKHLRIKVTVFSQNQSKLQKLLEDGKIYFIFPKSDKAQGQCIFVDQKWRRSYKLMIGDVVERELMDGDYAIINRQPSLHRQSMLAMQVVLHDELTIGLHLGYTRAFNADFDGDEMNIFMVFSLESIATEMHIMNVKQCIMNAQTNRPIASPHFDAYISAYLLTEDGVKLTKENFYQMLMAIDRPINVQELEEKGGKFGLITIENYSEYAPNDIINPFTKEVIVKKGQSVSEQDANYILNLSMQPGGQALRRSLDFRPMYSGKLLFSAALPSDFYYEFFKKADPEKGDKKDNVVVIKEGILISGRITSEVLGMGHNSIIQALYKFYPRYDPFLDFEKLGDTKVVEFITDITFILDRYLMVRGITIGVEDCMLNEQDRNSQETIIQDAIEQAMRATYKISKKLENPLEEERRESQIRRYMDTAKAVGGKVAKLLPSDNSLLSIIRSGAKGNDLNLSQITSMLGQMFYKGNRFPMTITNNSRCLPYFEPGSLDVRARGFCVNSFLTGLSPSELFFSQASGRLNLMDTALKTADVGEMHRRMNKILEDITVAYDGSVRNNTNRIFQFVYGEDGMDAAELQFVKSPGGDIPMFVDVFKEARRLNAKYEAMNEE